jgi:hypothetical protein
MARRRWRGRGGGEEGVESFQPRIAVEELDRIGFGARFIHSVMAAKAATHGTRCKFCFLNRAPVFSQRLSLATTVVTAHTHHLLTITWVAAFTALTKEGWLSSRSIAQNHVPPRNARASVQALKKSDGGLDVAEHQVGRGGA